MEGLWGYRLTLRRSICTPNIGMCTRKSSWTEISKRHLHSTQWNRVGGLKLYFFYLVFSIFFPKPVLTVEQCDANSASSSTNEFQFHASLNDNEATLKCSKIFFSLLETLKWSFKSNETIYCSFRCNNNKLLQFSSPCVFVLTLHTYVSIVSYIYNLTLQVFPKCTFKSYKYTNTLSPKPPHCY